MCLNPSKLIAFICALSGAHMLSACGSSEEKSALMQVDKKPVGVGNTDQANAKLEEAVQAKLDSDDQIKREKLTVHADVTRNQITISGAVSSEALRAKALELAKSAHAGVIVSDKMTVKSKASKSIPGSMKTRYV
jgi:osmotically-inducible protein OsmY